MKSHTLALVRDIDTQVRAAKDADTFVWVAWTVGADCISTPEHRPLTFQAHERFRLMRASAAKRYVEIYKYRKNMRIVAAE